MTIIDEHNMIVFASLIFSTANMGWDIKIIKIHIPYVCNPENIQTQELKNHV